MRDVVKDTFIYLGSTLVSKAIPFLFLPIITNYLAPDDFGYVATFLLFVTICSLVIQLATHGAVQVYYFELQEEERAKHFFNVLWIIIPSALLCLLTLYVFQDELNRVTLLDSKWLLLGIVCGLFDSISAVLLSLLRITKKAMSYSVIEILRAILSTGLSLALLVYWQSTWESRIIGAISTSALIALISCWILIRQKYVIYSFSLEIIKKYFHFGFPLLFHGLGGIAVANSNRFFLNYYVSVKATGLFSLSFQLATLIDVLAISINTAVLPGLYKYLASDETDKFKVTKLFYGLWLLYVAIAILMGMLAPWVLRVFFPSEYSEAAHYIPLIAFAMTFQGMYYLVSNLISFSKKTKYLGISTVVVGLFSVTLNYFCIIEMGADGAAIAMVGSYLLLFLMTWWLSHKCYPLPWFSKELLNWK